MTLPRSKSLPAALGTCLILLFLCTESAPATNITYFIRGDANGSGGVDISDAVRTLQFLFEGNVTLFCRDAADANDDGEIDLSDALFALRFLFGGGARIPEPYPACGDDPTPDSLSCTEHAGCIQFSKCPDPKAQTIRFQILRRDTPSSGTVEIEGTMKNIGGVFESDAGLQEVRLYEKTQDGTQRLVATRGFEDLTPQEEVQVRFKRDWDNSPFAEGKLPPSYVLEVSYEHGLGQDQNSRNDDCDFGNDQLEVSGDGINDLFIDR